MATVSNYTDKIAAQVPGVRASVREERDKVAGRARSALAEHHDQGDAEITTSNGKLDAFANLDDEAAAAIEWGGTTKSGRPIPGLHIMRRAMGGR